MTTTGIQARVLNCLVDVVPEARDEYPLTLLVDMFADAVSDSLRDRGVSEFVIRAFKFIEELAQSENPRVRNAVLVSFIEAASWGQLGAKPHFGPATREIINRADPGLIDPLLIDES